MLLDHTLPGGKCHSLGVRRSALHPCFEFSGYLSANHGFFALGSSWVDSSSFCCAQQLPNQLMVGILVWRGMCCYLALGCVDGSW